MPARTWYTTMDTDTEGKAQETELAFQRVRARWDESIARMVRSATSAQSWPRGPLDAGPLPKEPTPESASAFLSAVEAWVLRGDYGPMASWFSWPWPSGLLAFWRVARAIAIDAAAGAVDYMTDRLDALESMISARLDQVLAREEQATREMARQLEGVHTLASPLNTMTLQAGMAKMRVEMGATEGVWESLEELERAADRLINERRKLSEGVESWCHQLRRALRDMGALGEQ